MNQDHKDLLIAAAKAAGIDGVFRVNGYRQIYGISKQMDDELWNPITNLSDRYDLARRCELAVDWKLSEVRGYTSEGWPTLHFFTHNDDESEALAILRAAVASKGE